MIDILASLSWILAVGVALHWVVVPAIDRIPERWIP